MFVRAGIISLEKESRLFGESGTRIKINSMLWNGYKLQVFYVKKKKQNCHTFSFKISMKDFQAQREASSSAALKTRNFFFISFSFG
jgi:hypothetical protein